MSFYRYVKQPEREQKLWHFMDFAEFMLLLEKQSLFFVQATRLDDDLGGFGCVGQTVPGVIHTQTATAYQETADAARALLVVNSWHMVEQEMAVLWCHYSGRGAVLAVQSTVDRLSQGINYSTLKLVKLGQVSYHSPEIDPSDDGVSIEVDYFFRKNSFQHEREVRMIAQARDAVAVRTLGGTLVRVDLNRLIERVYVYPRAPVWVADLVRELAQRYGVEGEVICSDPVHDLVV